MSLKAEGTSGRKSAMRRKQPGEKKKNTIWCYTRALSDIHRKLEEHIGGEGLDSSVYTSPKMIRYYISYLGVISPWLWCVFFRRYWRENITGSLSTSVSEGCSISGIFFYWSSRLLSVHGNPPARSLFLKPHLAAYYTIVFFSHREICHRTVQQ